LRRFMLLFSMWVLIFGGLGQESAAWSQQTSQSCAAKCSISAVAPVVACPQPPKHCHGKSTTVPSAIVSERLNFESVRLDLKREPNPCPERMLSTVAVVLDAASFKFGHPNIGALPESSAPPLSRIRVLRI